jgi:hypothetical protein
VSHELPLSGIGGSREGWWMGGLLMAAVIQLPMQRVDQNRGGGSAVRTWR